MTIKYRRMAVFGIPWHPHPPHHLRYSHQKILAHYCFSRVKRRKGFAFQRTFWIFSSLFSFGSLIAEISAVSYATDLNFWSLKSFEICNHNHLFPLPPFSSSSFNICLDLIGLLYLHSTNMELAGSHIHQTISCNSCLIFQNLSDFIGFLATQRKF